MTAPHALTRTHTALLQRSLRACSESLNLIHEQREIDGPGRASKLQAPMDERLRIDAVRIVLRQELEQAVRIAFADVVAF